MGSNQLYYNIHLAIIVTILNSSLYKAQKNRIVFDKKLDTKPVNKNFVKVNNLNNYLTTTTFPLVTLPLLRTTNERYIYNIYNICNLQEREESDFPNFSMVMEVRG